MAASVLECINILLFTKNLFLQRKYTHYGFKDVYKYVQVIRLMASDHRASCSL